MRELPLRFRALARRTGWDRRPVQLGRPMALVEARADLLPAARTGMEKPLGMVYIGEQQIICLFAEEAFARFDRNWHWSSSLPQDGDELLPEASFRDRRALFHGDTSDRREASWVGKAPGTEGLAGTLYLAGARDFCSASNKRQRRWRSDWIFRPQRGLCDGDWHRSPGLRLWLPSLRPLTRAENRSRNRETAGERRVR